MISKTQVQRPIPVGWQSAPLDMQAIGFKGMMIIHVPVRKEWTETERARVAQEAADAALKVVVKHETGILS